MTNIPLATKNRAGLASPKLANLIDPITGKADHLDLDNIGSNSHSAIDAHISDGSLHGARIGYVKNGKFEGDTVGLTPANAVTSNATITTTSTSGEVLFGTKSAKINSSTDGGTVYLDCDALDPGLVGQGVTFSISTKGLSSYAPVADSEEFQFFIYKLTGSNTGYLEYTKQSVPAGSYNIVGTFIPDEAAVYVPIFKKVGVSSQTIAIDEAILQAKTTVLAPSGTDWISYSATVIGAGTQTVTAKYKIENGDVTVAVAADITSAGSGAYAVTLPPGINIDFSRMTAIGSDANVGGGNGYASINSGTTRYTLTTDFGVNTPDRFYLLKANSTTLTSGDFANSMALWTVTSFPAVGYSSQVQVLDRALEEYAYNSSTSTGTDLTSFGYGLTGAAFQTYSASGTGYIQKRVRFQSRIQPTDKIRMKVQDPTTGLWQYLETNTRLATIFQYQDTQAYGCQIVFVSDYEISVLFAEYSRPSGNAAFGAAGSAWDTSWKWVIEKISQGALVGAGPIESRYVKGVTDGSDALTGFVGERKVTTQTFTGLAENPNSYGAATQLTPGEWSVKIRAGVSVIAPTRVSVQLGDSAGVAITSDSDGAETLYETTDAGNTSRGLNAINQEIVLRVTSTTTYTVKFTAGVASGSTAKLEFTARRIR